MNPTLLDVCKVGDTLTTIQNNDAAIFYINGFKILHNGVTLEIAGLELRVQDVVSNPELLETYLQLFKRIGGEYIFPYAYLRAYASNTQAELDAVLAAVLEESSQYPACPGQMYVPSYVFPMYADVHTPFTEYTICEFCLKHGCKRDAATIYELVNAARYHIGDRFSCDCDEPHPKLLEAQKVTTQLLTVSEAEAQVETLAHSTSELTVSEAEAQVEALYPDTCPGCGIRFRYTEHEPVCDWCAYKQAHPK